MVRHDEVGSDIYKKVLMKLLGNSVKLILHGIEVNNGSDSDDACGLLVEDSRRNDVKCELSVFVHNSMACIVSALISDYDISVGCEIVYYPTLSFIAPLGADN